MFIDHCFGVLKVMNLTVIFPMHFDVQRVHGNMLLSANNQIPM
jgi:hypothetical protein